MNTIMHRIIIEATPNEVYNALTDEQKLSLWWTKASHHKEDQPIMRFYFGPNGDHQVDMAIHELSDNQKVVWKCTAGPWAHTEAFNFTLAEDERGTALEFTNTGWESADAFFMHCNTKWGFFLAVSLKGLLEKGTGQPHPNDPNI